MTMPLMMSGDNGLNEVQLPKELQRLDPGRRPLPALASMKCSSRRNCNLSLPFSWVPLVRPQ